jgi:hypothetical protein
MDQHQWQLAEQQSSVVGSVLLDWSRAIDAASEKLEGIESNLKTGSGDAKPKD